MHRRTIPAALVAVAALAGTSSASAAPLPDPEQIAPGGRIAAVAAATARDGWPHETTLEEGRAIADLATWYYGITAPRGTTVSVGCFLNVYADSAYCGITYTRAGRRVLAFRTDVTIKADGGYLYRRAPRRATRPTTPAPPKVNPSWCNGTTEGFCNPVDPAILAPIAPDAPRAERLRRELVKARAALAACRGAR